MPSIKNHGIKIYYETSGSGHPIVLLHGFTNSMQIWKVAGYVTALETRYQVILIDQRGHGNSDKPPDSEDYALEKRWADVMGVVDHLGIEKFSLLGYSMGGWLAFTLALQTPQRISSLIVGGAHPFEEKIKAFNDVDGSDEKAFIDALSDFIGEEIPPQYHPLILNNDLKALCAAAHNRPSLQARLPEMVMPCLLFVGEKDRRVSKVHACAPQFPCAELLVVPSAGHVSTLLETDLLLPEITHFLKKNTSDRRSGSIFKISNWLQSRFSLKL